MKNLIKFGFSITCVSMLLMQSVAYAQQNNDTQSNQQNTDNTMNEVNPFTQNNKTASPQVMSKAPDKVTSKTIIKTPNYLNTVLSPYGVLPFGYNLFQKLSPQSDKTGISPQYKLVAGDRIKLNIWGAFSNESTLTVDAQGNVFIPDVGPIHVAGITASNLNNFIQSKIRTVYQDTVEVYINLEDRVPVSVFVTGHVVSPGRYAGNPGDSLIDYLVRAGGIDAQAGSYRMLTIKRHNKIIENFDLYDFLTFGTLPKATLQEGDSIVVNPKTVTINVLGGVKDALSYELPLSNSGKDLLNYAQLGADITHVKIAGTRDNIPFNRYMGLNEFQNTTLFNGDILAFEAGTHNDSFNISISGEHLGAKSMTIPKNARLHEVLQNIPVDPMLARIDAIYLKRASVAVGQKKSIQDSIKRLQETLLLARPSGNTSEVAISEGELQLLEKFMARTEALEPEGRVVVVGRENILDIALEPNDEIIIPTRSDLISINGEVILPQAIAWNDKDTVVDYVERSGGFTDNANKDKILVIRANGETEIGDTIKVLPGDEIIVMPEVKVNNLKLASTISDIIYKSVLAVAIPLNFGD
jgi:protein involved in polysaccharide export with SLBB domain